MRTLLRLRDDETLLVQSGKPVGVFRTHEGAPRVLIANSLLVPRWATWDEFRRLEAEGLTMFGQMTAGSWIYIGTQGILQGTYQTFAAAGEKHFGSADLSGRTILTAGLGGMGGAQPLAATMAGAAILCIEVDPSRIERRLETRYLDEVADSLDDGVARVRTAASEGRALSVAVLGNAAEIVPELARNGESFDLVTDQTAAHDPLTGYIPVGLSVEEAASLRGSDPEEYLRRARASIAAHVEGMLEFVRAGSYVFDYGNNLRGEADEAGVAEAFSYPGFVPAYIRPLFCRGVGPFRWAVLSGDPADIAAIDEEFRRLFPDDALLQRWLELAPERVAFQGLPARICWLGYGDRAKAGLAINELVRTGAVTAPVVIGRDHLDAGSVASPYRETEAMRDGSDAIADWPILNALLNTAAGATWVASTTAAESESATRSTRAWSSSPTAARTQRTASSACSRPTPARACWGTPMRATTTRSRLRASMRLLLTSPASIRRAPDVPKLLIRDLRQVVSPAGADAPVRGRALGELDLIENGYVLCDGDTITAVGRMSELGLVESDIEDIDGAGLCAIPGLVDCHTHPAFGGDRVDEFSLRAGGASYEELHAAGGGILSTVRATREAGEEGLRRAVERHAGWMLAAGTTTFEGKSGYGLDREAELASLRAIGAAGGVPTFLGAHSTPPEFSDADAYLDFLLADVLPDAARVAEAADVFLERGAFDVAQARRYLEACSGARPRAPPARRPVHRGGSDPARGRARRPLRRSPRGNRPGRHNGPRCERRHRRAAAGERTLPRPADAARARPRRRGRRCRARDRLQPRQRLLREPAGRAVARGDATQAEPRGGTLGLHRERRARPRQVRSDRQARPRLCRRHRAARRARLALRRLSPRGRCRRDRDQGRRRGPETRGILIQWRPRSSNAAGRS